MARPRSEDKREAIIDAATRVIAAEGLGAPTARIASEAGVANGSLFTYFATKADLLNALYVELKQEMAALSMSGMPDGDAQAQLRHAWTRWIGWATSFPEKRRALALVSSSEDITEASHRAGNRAMAEIAQLLERCRANGPMRNVPLGFVSALMMATAEATIDFVLSDAANATRHSRAGFEALWRMLT